MVWFFLFVWSLLYIKKNPFYCSVVVSTSKVPTKWERQPGSVWTRAAKSTSWHPRHSVQKEWPCLHSTLEEKETLSIWCFDTKRPVQQKFTAVYVRGPSSSFSGQGGFLHPARRACFLLIINQVKPRHLWEDLSSKVNMRPADEALCVCTVGFNAVK